jgi:VanZ family protein
MVRVRGRIKVEGVVEGEYQWRAARLLLLQYDARNKWIPCDHGVVSASGTKGWAHYADVFRIADSAVHVDAVLQHWGLAGTAWFDSVMAEPVAFRSSFYWFQGLFALLWLGAGILYYRRCRLHVRKLRILILLNAMAILFGTLVPGATIQAATDGLKEYVSGAAREPAESAQEHVGAKKPAGGGEAEQKRIDRFVGAVDGAHVAGHFALFACLCFLVYLSAYLERQPPAYYPKVAFDILIFAAVTESLQNLTLDRTAGIADWRTDLYGLLAGFSVFVAVRLLLGLAGRKRALGV